MQDSPPFGDLLEMVDHLSLEGQQMMVEIVRRRLAEHGRHRIATEIREAGQEFAAGRCRTATVDEIMNEISH